MLIDYMSQELPAGITGMVYLCFAIIEASAVILEDWDDSKLYSEIIKNLFTHISGR